MKNRILIRFLLLSGIIAGGQISVAKTLTLSSTDIKTMDSIVDQVNKEEKVDSYFNKWTLEDWLNQNKQRRFIIQKSLESIHENNDLDLDTALANVYEELERRIEQKLEKSSKSEIIQETKEYILSTDSDEKVRKVKDIYGSSRTDSSSEGQYKNINKRQSLRSNKLSDNSSEKQLNEGSSNSFGNSSKDDDESENYNFRVNHSEDSEGSNAYQQYNESTGWGNNSNATNDTSDRSAEWDDDSAVNNYTSNRGVEWGNNSDADSGIRSFDEKRNKKYGNWFENQYNSNEEADVSNYQNEYSNNDSAITKNQLKQEDLLNKKTDFNDYESETDTSSSNTSEEKSYSLNNDFLTSDKKNNRKLESRGLTNSGDIEDDKNDSKYAYDTTSINEDSPKNWDKYSRNEWFDSNEDSQKDKYTDSRKRNDKYESPLDDTDRRDNNDVANGNMANDEFSNLDDSNSRKLKEVNRQLDRIADQL